MALPCDRCVLTRTVGGCRAQVLLGLTVLAYSHDGLRDSDVRSLLLTLKRRLDQEPGVFVARPTRALFDRWLVAAHASTTASSSADSEASQPNPSSIAGSGWAGGVPGADAARSWFGVLPLEVLRPDDPAQLAAACKALRRLPQAIRWYLRRMVFPSPVLHQQVRFASQLRAFLLPI